MGSIAMHLVISEKIKEKYGFSDDFLVGSVLPDIEKKFIDRDITHYTKKFKIKDQILSLPDIEKYINENNEKIKEKDEFTLGYLAHLIEDKLWFRDYSGEYLHTAGFDEKGEELYTYKNESYKIIHKEKETINKVYNDYKVLNDYISEKYFFDINLINKKCKEYFNNEEKHNKVIDKMITLIHTNNKEISFFTHDLFEKYFKESVNEIIAIFDNLFK